LDISPFDPSQLDEPLGECLHAGFILWIISFAWQQHADAPHALILLRTHYNRPSCSPAK
jgi:hypothetical protein